MSAHNQPIQDSVAAFCKAWSDRDLNRLISLWDMDDRDCSYLPADSESRLLGPSAVKEFFADTMRRFEVIRMRPGSVYPRRLNKDLGAAFAKLDWARSPNQTSQPIGGSIRVSVVVRLSGNIWRLCHYAEAPLAPIVELRSYYQKVAADGHEVMG